MKQTYDTDAILYGILNAAPGLVSALTGGIYAGQRPDNSQLEDVAVNTLNLTQEFEPQIGTSNVNIHVPDMTVKIKGAQQKVEDRIRLKQLSEIVLTALRSAKIPGLTLSIEWQVTISEPEISQHYVNIRINWNIH